MIQKIKFLYFHLYFYCLNFLYLKINQNIINQQQIRSSSLQNPCFSMKKLILAKIINFKKLLHY
jgi:hypothetical protein